MKIVIFAIKKQTNPTLVVGMFYPKTTTFEGKQNSFDILGNIWVRNVSDPSPML